MQDIPQTHGKQKDIEMRKNRVGFEPSERTNLKNSIFTISRKKIFRRSKKYRKFIAPRLDLNLQIRWNYPGSSLG